MNLPSLESPMTDGERASAITKKFEDGFRPDDDTLHYGDAVFTYTLNAIHILTQTGRLAIAAVDVENGEVEFHEQFDGKIPEQMHDMLCFVATVCALGRTDDSKPMQDAKAITNAMTDPSGQRMSDLLSARCVVAYDHVIRNRRLVRDDGARSVSDLPDSTES